MLNDISILVYVYSNMMSCVYCSTAISCYGEIQTLLRIEIWYDDETNIKLEFVFMM